MLESRVSRILLGLGAVVGVLGATVLALEMQPLLNFPDWIVRVAMIKLTFVASAGLLAGGALVGRHARHRALSEPNAALELEEAVADSIVSPHSVRAPQGVERRSDTPA